MDNTNFGGLDMFRPEVVEATKMPRTAAIPVVRDARTGYLNAGASSCGVFSLNPFAAPDLLLAAHNVLTRRSPE